MRKCYVLFVKTGNEENIVETLKARLDQSCFFPFIPQKEMLFRRKGNVIKIKKPCFSGYVFVESDLCPDFFRTRMHSLLYTIKEVYRIVNYGDDRGDIEMRESERISLKELYSESYFIQSSIGIMEGDRIWIKEGPLMGRESVIRKVNRHNREAVIEMEFMGEMRELTVGLEIMKKV